MSPDVSFSSGSPTDQVDLTTPGLLRAARALAQVDAGALAKKADVGVVTVKRIETGRAPGLRPATQAALAHALLALGVELVPPSANAGPGVRLVSAGHDTRQPATD